MRPPCQTLKIESKVEKIGFAYFQESQKPAETYPILVNLV
jgi:hypothetical protein